jgi:hypothetical protein
MKSWAPRVVVLAVAAASALGCASDDGDRGTGSTGGAGGSGGGGTGGSGTGGSATGGGGTGGSGGTGGEDCVGFYDYCEDGKVVSGTCDPCQHVDCDMPGNYVACGNLTCVMWGQVCPNDDAGAGDATDGDAGSDDADAAGGD